MRKNLLLSALTFFMICGKAQNYIINSPDKKLSAEIEINQGITVKVLKEGESLFSLNGLSLDIDRYKPVNFTIKKISRNYIDEEIMPVIRDKSKIYKNNFNELTIVFKSSPSLTLILYNEGFAYRFSTSVKDSLIIQKENLQITFHSNDSIRFQSNQSFNSAYESPYEFKKLSELEDGNLCNLPILIQKQKGTFVMITESDLYNYPGLWVRGTGKSQLNATNPPYLKKLACGDPYEDGQISKSYNYIAKTNGTRRYPWRIFAITDYEEGLINNNMVYLLASPTELKDVSWIKPGVVMLDWWGKHNIYGVDFKAGINTETAKYIIDFCTAHGFRYFLFDAGWSKEDDLLHEVQGLNMTEVSAYAKEKGVDLMLWVVWNSLRKQWDAAFDQFEKWGIKGVKMDYMNRDDQSMVEFYESVAQKAAEKKMVVDFHGAYKPSGLSRKYPNLLTSEALLEFEQSGGTNWDNPEHHNLLPYIRMFTGPMDYLPATMRNSTISNFRMLNDYPMGMGTRAHAIALFIILSSPMVMLPDSPSDYYREKECIDFIAKIPVEWDESILLKGKIAKFTIIARRSGEDWFIGAITNDEERTIDIPTNFLKQGKYHIELIEDGINANTRATDYKLIEKKFSSGELIKLKMASAGGWVARITPAK